MSNEKKIPRDHKFLESMLSATLDLLDAKEKDKTAIGYHHTNFLASLIATLVLRVINRKELETFAGEKRDKEAVKRFGDSKLKIQDIVSLAFQIVMREISGQDMEYYVTIKPVPKPTTKVSS